MPIAVCAAEATATRLARKKYVQGSDSPVRTMELLKIDGKWYASSAAINIVDPTSEDVSAQAVIDAKREAMAKAKAAGLTDADLLALGLTSEATDMQHAPRSGNLILHVRVGRPVLPCSAHD